MNTVSRTITGMVLIVLGLVLVSISFLLKFVTLIYGVPLLIIGLFILLNKKEDTIEEIKSKGLSKKMKANQRFPLKHQRYLKGGKK